MTKELNEQKKSILNEFFNRCNFIIDFNSNNEFNSDDELSSELKLIILHHQVIIWHQKKYH